MSEKRKCTYHGELYLAWCKVCQLIQAEADAVKSGRELLEPRHEGLQGSFTDAELIAAGQDWGEDKTAP